MLNKKPKVMHLLASNVYSGAENMVCQLINIVGDSSEMVYVSPNGAISKQLEEKGIKFMPLNKLSLKEVKRVVKDFKPDIIHAHDIKASIYASMLGKKIPVVAHVHGSDAPTMSKLSLKSFLFYLASKKIKHIFWVSKSCLDIYKFKKQVADKSSVLYNIISLEKLYEKAGDGEIGNKYDIAYLGRLEEVKNPLRLLEILGLVIKANPSVKCAIMGDGSLKSNCENYIRENQLEESIKMLGFINNPQTILKNCKLLLMSSISEGTPMCTLEALGLGVPVVSTPTDGMVDLIRNGENGFLYSSNEEAVAYILSIINGEHNFKENCINFSKDYNNTDSYKQKLLIVYGKLLKK